ncbi:MAG TPA: M1 family aminopeptidase [Luteibaculaceae bacterium]|nr:M1 family aminopeptidase [Luteibaculaceae bacterium]
MRHLIGLLFGLLISPAGNGQSLTEIEKHAESELLRYSASLRANRSFESASVDMTYLRATWDFSTRDSVGGQMHFHVTWHTAQERILKLKLHPQLSIFQITVNGSSQSYNRDDDEVTIAVDLPNAPIQDTLQLVIDITYGGFPPKGEGFGSFSSADRPIGSYAQWTLSQPYGASDWFPTFSYLNDKIDSVDIHVITRSDHLAASNGMLQSVNVNPDGTRVHHWKHRHSIAPYLIGVAVANYTEVIDSLQTTSGPVLFQNFLYPETADAELPFVNATKRFMPIFEELFGPFPYSDEKYGHAQFGWGGGMEHQTMSFMGTFSYEIVSHELAHHWFGNPVTCASWRDIWLNEGFATYLTGLCFERESPSEFWPLWKNGALNKVFRTPGTVWVEDTSSVARLFNSDITYFKGAMVLHMLRKHVGDSLFFLGCRNYLSLFHNQHAFTDQFKDVMETTSGKDLDLFFDQWIRSFGHPEVDIQYEMQGNDLLVAVDQPFVASATEKPFQFPLELTWMEGQQRRDTVLLVTRHRETFTIPQVTDVDALEANPSKEVVVKIRSLKNSIAPKTQVYPNPAREEVVFYHAKNLTQPFSLILIDVMGRSVQLPLERLTDSEVRANLEGLPAGLYTYLLRSDNESQSGKIVKITP